MTVEKVMKLSEVKFGDLIKFSKNSKVDWFIGYKDRDEIEMWSSNDTTRTILDSSKTWNKKIIIVGQNLTPAFSPADFNDEIQAEADSGLPDREVIETMKCFMCEWTGHPDDLVAITDEPESINDFVHCPICKCNVW